MLTIKAKWLQEAGDIANMLSNFPYMVTINVNGEGLWVKVHHISCGASVYRTVTYLEISFAKSNIIVAHIRDAFAECKRELGE